MPNKLLNEALRKYGSLDLAHRAVMLQDAQEVLATDRRQTRELNLLAATGEAMIDEEDDMPGDIIIGDHYHTQPAPKKSSMGTLGKVAIAGALLASGVGAGAAIPIVLDLLNNKTQQIQDTDTNTQYEFDLPDAD